MSAKPIPAWNRDAIARFLANSVWEPIVAPQPQPTGPQPAPRLGAPIYHYENPPPMRLVPADFASSVQLGAGQALVLQRRIEKQGKAILVEVNDQVFELQRCAGKAAYACLVQTDLALSPIEAPATGFAQPPP